jgi:hypothetical protein
MIEKAGAYLDDVLDLYPGTGRGHVLEIVAMFEQREQMEEMMAHKNRVDEYRSALRMICDFAYEQVFHEMGVDPLKCFEAALREEHQLAKKELAATTTQLVERLRAYGEGDTERLSHMDALEAANLLVSEQPK